MFRLIQGLLLNQQRLNALAVCQCAPSERTELKEGGWLWGDGVSLPISLGSWGLQKDLSCGRQAVHGYWRYFISTSANRPEGLHLTRSSTNVGTIKNLNLTLSDARGGTDPISHKRRRCCIFFLEFAQGKLICSHKICLTKKNYYYYYFLIQKI